MSITQYLKEIGRGSKGSTSLSREQAHDAMQHLLCGTLDRLQLGAFCMAMRIKGETTDEFAGFLAAVRADSQLVQHDCKLVILPSYNGSRRLPNLTPLLALLLAQAGRQHGFGVLLHGHQTESTRMDTATIINALTDAWQAQTPPPEAGSGNSALSANCPVHWTTPACGSVQPGNVLYAPLRHICPALADMLNFRTSMGVRNSGHSLVKLMLPCVAPQSALLVSSYTHPEYLHSMGDAITATATNALLLRGTEGEAIADPRRMPRMDSYIAGTHQRTWSAQKGSVARLPALPDRAVAETVRYTLDVLTGKTAAPDNLVRQVTVISELMQQLPSPASAKPEAPAETSGSST